MPKLLGSIIKGFKLSGKSSGLYPHAVASEGTFPVPSTLPPDSPQSLFSAEEEIALSEELASCVFDTA